MVKLLIARPTAELPRYYEYYDSLDQLQLPPGTEVLPCHSSSPARNRNNIIKTALELDKFTHIFFTDDDHIYPPDTVIKLLEHDVDIVSGMYNIKYYPYPIIALGKGDSISVSIFESLDKYGPNELVPVQRVPAGALLVTTEALKKLQNYLYVNYIGYHDMWFTLGQYKPDEWCDDIWFCDRMLNAGIQPYIATDVPVGHITKCTLMPFYNEKEKRWETKFMINEDYKRITSMPVPSEQPSGLK